MKKTPRKPPSRIKDQDTDTMRPEYDFSKARRNATAARFAKGTNVVLLDPDVQEAFPTSESVNEALRVLAGIATRTANKRKRRSA
jgi:Trm5-related predicted tRNA methylase